MVTINGEPVAAAGQTLLAYLQSAGYTPVRIAVEINRNIIPKASYEQTILQDGDTVEIVQFVGGG